MRCHYVWDEKAGKVLIPGCWPVVLSGDIRDCICKSEFLSETSFENERYRKELTKRNEVIKELQEENESLRHDVDKYITIIEKSKEAL